MSEDSPSRIVITTEELADAHIDEVLRHQKSFFTPPAPVPKSKFRLVYAAWFYLMVAGALGALAGWAVMEPSFRDQIGFTGKVEAVEPDEMGPFRGPVTIQGRLSVAGVNVYVAPSETKIRRPGETNKLSLRDIAAGDIVSVRGIKTSQDNAVVAIAVRLEDRRTPPDPMVDLASLDFQQKLFGFIFLPVVAGFIGFAVGGVEGIVCRTYARAAWCAAIGLVAGLLGGALSTFVAGIIYAILGELVPGSPTASGAAFVFQMFRRGLAWTVAGMAVGLGQGFALKSSKLKFNGFVGGIVGGLIGGLLFDPISLLLTSQDGFSGAGLSRAVGIAVIGCSVGLMIGFTDLLSRDAWLKVLTGPLHGKEFSFNVTPVRVGSSPKNEIYLFKDPKIDPLHAEINKLRDAYEIVDNKSKTGTFVNGQPVGRARLSDGARIRIGDSEFSFACRERATR